MISDEKLMRSYQNWRIRLNDCSGNWEFGCILNRDSQFGFVPSEFRVFEASPNYHDLLPLLQCMRTGLGEKPE